MQPNITGDWRPLNTGGGATAQIGSGSNFPAVKLVQIFEPSDWEGFTEEYVEAIKPPYKKTMRFTGAGDMGRDVVGFSSDKHFQGPWDNFQCKRYGNALVPSDVWVEMGKIIYYAFRGEFLRPANYYFAGSKDIGLKLKKLLTDPDELKAQLIANWDEYCKTGPATVFGFTFPIEPAKFFEANTNCL